VIAGIYGGDPEPTEEEPSADVAVEKIANPPEVIELGPPVGDTSASEPDEDVPSAKPPPKGRRPPARKPKPGERLVIWGTNRHGGRWEILWVPAGMGPARISGQSAEPITPCLRHERRRNALRSAMGCHFKMRRSSATDH
jgi:hypothetical protein